ncbi:hypothetical protein ACJ73_05474 [Blastomyces percursus]|uniref:G-protein coupled receptors family 3 profile domain-containing protein n=1 Tax=Blastomyces percursus TaxID=1658174 RepID=A0A1J9Q3T8_9EURO|nr:hypothetical protein ACJ73_05474 [Blastomyces percursus]
MSQQSGFPPGPPGGKPMSPPPGPPYPPTTAGLGGRPSNSVDVPITAVFLMIFIIGAVCHMTLFRKNMARGHKFIPSAATFGFCMARITASVLRIVWANRLTNAQVAIAAQVFVAAGVLLLFILNLLYTQRIFRATHPRIGWSRPFSYAFKALYILIILTLVMVIIATVQSFYTLDKDIRLIDRNLQWWGVSYFTFVSFLPIPLLAFIVLAPRRQPTEQFGQGSLRAKILIAASVSVLLCLGACFRAGTTFMPPRMANDPAWYHHKACFYIFNFGIEATVVFLYFLSRVDLRFHVPNGSSKVRTYTIESTADSVDEKDVDSEAGGAPEPAS